MSGPSVKPQASGTKGMPVPESGIAVVAASGSLLEIVSVPPAAPRAVGANVTLTVTDAPGSTVNAEEGAILKPALAAMEATFSVALPSLVTVTMRLADWPTVTFPNASAFGATLIWAWPGSTPTPSSARLKGDKGSLLAMLSDPRAAPVVRGSKRTVTFCVPPGATSNGVLGERTVKPIPNSRSAATVRVAAPRFETSTARSFVWPVATLPKSRMLGETLIAVPPEMLPFTARFTGALESPGN